MGYAIDTTENSLCGAAGTHNKEQAVTATSRMVNSTG